MKKLFAFLCVVGLLFFFTSPVTAGGIDNKTNWSVEYIRSLNRNASTDGADIVLYNPAGTVKYEDGFYGNLSLHYIKKEYNNNIDGWNAAKGTWSEDRESDEPSMIPGVYGVYKKLLNERYDRRCGEWQLAGNELYRWELLNYFSAAIAAYLNPSL